METNKVNSVVPVIDGKMFDFSKCKSEHEMFSIFFNNEKVLANYIPEDKKFSFPEKKGIKILS